MYRLIMGVALAACGGVEPVRKVIVEGPLRQGDAWVHLGDRIDVLTVFESEELVLAQDAEVLKSSRIFSCMDLGPGTPMSDFRVELLVDSKAAEMLSLAREADLTFVLRPEEAPP